MKYVIPFAFLFCACGFAGMLWIDWANIGECATWSPTYDLHACAVGPLPHRPVDSLTTWGQGRAPANNHCPPNTIRFETDEGLFLECSNVGHYYRGNVP